MKAANSKHTHTHTHTHTQSEYYNPRAHARRALITSTCSGVDSCKVYNSLIIAKFTSRGIYQTTPVFYTTKTHVIPDIICYRIPRVIMAYNEII